MSKEWSILLSSDDQKFIQKMQWYYDLYEDMNAEWSQKVFPLVSQYLEDVNHFQPPAQAQYWYLTFYGNFKSICNAEDYLKDYNCIICYDAGEHLNELANLCSQFDLQEIYAFTNRSDAEYFAELMVGQYACDQLIGVDNTCIRDLLASNAQSIKLLRKQSITAYDEVLTNVYRALLYVKSNNKSLYDFSVVFEDIYKLLPNLDDCLFMAYFNNPLFIEEQGLVYVESEIPFQTKE